METDRKRLIIHAGMHKTGSTSIQHWLSNDKWDNAHYLKWHQANHSNLFVLLFEDNAENYFYFKKQGLTKEDVARRRQRNEERLHDQITKSDKQTFIFSAERISSAPDAAVKRMHAFFSDYFTDIEVYAYARRPGAFMTSMFQQHLKTGSVQLNAKQLWPGYQTRFARFDDIFGRDHVHLRLYDDLKRKGTDAVTDFSNWLGLSTNTTSEVRRNQSMKSSAVALLYFYRKFVEQGFTDKERKTADDFVVNNLRKIEGEPFALNIDMTHADLVHVIKDDLQWMSKRLGTDVDDLGNKSGEAVTFSGEDDLTRMAISSSHLLLPDDGLPALDPDSAGAHDETVRRLTRFSQQAKT